MPEQEPISEAATLLFEALNRIEILEEEIEKLKKAIADKDEVMNELVQRVGALSHHKDSEFAHQDIRDQIELLRTPRTQRTGDLLDRLDNILFSRNNHFMTFHDAGLLLDLGNAREQKMTHIGNTMRTMPDRYEVVAMQDVPDLKKRPGKGQVVRMTDGWYAEIREREQSKKNKVLWDG